MQLSIRHLPTTLLLLACTACHATTARADDAPKTIDEAYQRLATLFGKPQDPAKLTRFVIDEEIETQPDKDGPKVIVVNKGQEVLTNPTIDGESIVYSQNEILVRDVFNESNDGKRKLNRHLDRTYAMENRITRFSGLWIVQRRLVNHSLPRFSRMTISTGTVKWLDNGIELAMSGFDTFYAPDGTVQPKAYVSIDRYTTDGDKLVYESLFKSYKAAADPDGAQLLAPDLDKPSGKPISLKRVSEPRTK
ncbi:hypothetical protein [Allorhodopirellula solitaria]|uniref:Uncharacterized protein n=1 Tax=Allorhodopirellula solitaria TaxID=2527987 RepID=A0A5C5YFM1_9BACT|nr:hypothetical protein [Allorhodopirellula solitaria]TWT73281.1 hypothetical protein CA85_17490 [Allorhodopirellula solitaria]